MPTTGSSGASIALEEATPAQEILPTAQIYMLPANLPPPKPLVMDDNLTTNWNAWKKAWTRYEVATGVNKQEQLVRVSTLLSVIGEDAKIAFDAFEWGETEDDSTIEDVLAKFDEYCEPRTQVIYERYRFNNRNQEPGESIASYLTELRTTAKNCQHESITPDEILRDRIVLGIRDDKMRERLLRLNDLALQKAVDLIKAAEQTEQQVKLMSGNPGGTLNVNSLKQGSGKNNNRFKKTHQKREVSRHLCGRSGTKHPKKNCLAFGQKCHRCGNLNHYQSLCRTKLVATVGEEDSEGDESYEICTVDEDFRPSVNKAFVDIFVSTKKPGNQVQFQVDTGSECNLLPINCTSP